MKAKVIAGLMICAVALSACSFNKGKELSEESGSVFEKVEQDTASEETNESGGGQAETEANIPDNTAGNPSDTALVEKAVAEAGATMEEARYVQQRDFDGDGKEEAFVFIGSEADPDWLTCSGTLYFVNENECKTLMDNDSFFVYEDKLIEVVETEGKTYAHARIAFTTESVSYLYYVENGEVQESMISGLGAFFKSDYADCFCISLGLYDGSIEFTEEGHEEEGMGTGHTWKNYYFYYDKDAGDFREYVGEEVSEEELNAAVGFDLAGEIRGEGYTVDRILKRPNGIINVNYSKITKQEDGTFWGDYHNATYNTNTGKFADAWGAGTDDWQGSDYGGRYLKGITVADEAIGG